MITQFAPIAGNSGAPVDATGYATAPVVAQFAGACAPVESDFIGAASPVSARFQEAA